MNRKWFGDMEVRKEGRAEDVKDLIGSDEDG